jgi:hypothetical protein
MLVLAFVAVAIAGCDDGTSNSAPLGKPIPHVAVAPADCKPVKLLLVGDSLMKQSAQTIIGELHRHGYPVDALVDAHGGSSVVEYSSTDSHDHPDPRADLQAHLDAFQPDIVLVDWGINTVDSMWGPDGPSASLEQTVQADMHEVVQMVSAAGAQLYWTTIPWRDDDPAAAAYANDVNSWIADLDVPLVDWRGAVSDARGSYAQHLESREDHVVRQVRTDDRLHFTPDGIERVAAWTASTLAPEACAHGS